MKENVAMVTALVRFGGAMVSQIVMMNQMKKIAVRN